MFQAGQASLNVMLGGLNTLVLITSGYCAARAVQARALKGVTPSRLWLLDLVLIFTMKSLLPVIQVHIIRRVVIMSM